MTVHTSMQSGLLRHWGGGGAFMDSTFKNLFLFPLCLIIKSCFFLSKIMVYVLNYQKAILQPLMGSWEQQISIAIRG